MANKILTREGRKYYFRDTPGAPYTYVPMTLAGMVNGAGRVSASVNHGWLSSSDPRPTLYRWNAKFKLAAPATIGNVIEIYLLGKDDTNDQYALTNPDFRRNLHRVGVVEVDNASGTPTFYASGVVQVFDYLISLVVWNASGQTFSATPGDCEIVLTALIDEVQNPE